MSNVSYELRTPLTNILGFAESLSLGIAGELKPKQQEYLRDIQDSSQDLLVIIDAILDLTTIDAGAMTSRKVSARPRWCSPGRSASRSSPPSPRAGSCASG